jgi:glycosyltransferase involved in cell wall biosynthesis
MRVLHIIDTNGLGGAQSLLSGFVGHRASTTHHRIFALRRHAKQLLMPSEHVEVFKSSSRYSLAPVNRLREKMLQETFDIIHCHLPRSMAFRALLASTTNSPVSLVAHEHGQILGSNDRTLLSDLAYCTLKRTTKGAFAQHIAVSNATRAALTKRVNVPSDDITVIPSFVDTSKYNSESRLLRRQHVRAPLKLSDNDFVVGIAGRITAKKGWRVFIDALRQFSTSDRIPVAVVTGDGPERQEFEHAVAELPSDIKIYDLRWVEDIRDYYAMLDCFIAPSFAEGSPVAAREAMAVGLPIITSSAEGFLDLISDNETGLIFPVGDSESLAHQISVLIADRHKAGFLAENAARKANDFSVEKYLSALDTVYAKCLPCRENK